MTKTEAVETAALHLRVMARRSGKAVTVDMAWDSIAQLGNLGKITLSAQEVLRVARRELRANQEFHLV